MPGNVAFHLRNLPVEDRDWLAWLCATNRVTQTDLVVSMIDELRRDSRLSGRMVKRSKERRKKIQDKRNTGATP